MRKLTKTPKPNILKLQAKGWTEEIMRFYYKGLPVPKSDLDRYRHPDIKASLILETEEKCAYCESYIADTYPGDIEHILPKSLFPRWAFYWNNLTIACSICNNSKGNYASKSLPLLNPYKDNIPNYLTAIGPILMHINSNQLGEFTIKKLKLNRKSLIERRIEAINSFQNMLDIYNRENNSDAKALYKDELLDMLATNKEYTFTLRCYAIAQSFLP